MLNIGHCLSYIPYCICQLSCVNLSGSMSLTRIKDAFVIFKNLVLEGRNNQESSGVISSDGDPDLSRQIEDLRSCLLQRDTEIAILVNMVNKGKNENANFISDCGDGDSFATPAKEMRSTDRMISGTENDHDFGDSSGFKEEINKKAKSRDLKAQSVLKEDRESRIVKRHLFGVPPPDDRTVFDDMSGMHLLLFD